MVLKSHSHWINPGKSRRLHCTTTITICWKNIIFLPIFLLFWLPQNLISQINDCHTECPCKYLDDPDNNLYDFFFSVTPNETYGISFVFSVGFGQEPLIENLVECLNDNESVCTRVWYGCSATEYDSNNATIVQAVDPKNHTIQGKAFWLFLVVWNGQTDVTLNFE